MTNAPEFFKPAVPPTNDSNPLPSLDLLQRPDLTDRSPETKEALMAKAGIIQQTLVHLGINVSLGDITPGPAVTRYELNPAPNVDLERIFRLSRNLAAALKTESIHILAPIPRKNTVGIEVPNDVRTTVHLREIFESDEWRNTPARIPLALGMDMDGHPMIADLADIPNLLIAGRPGSGRSVCLNSIIMSLLYRFSPEQLRLVMIDTQVTELISYNVLPHLVAPLVTDFPKALLALRWVLYEIESRAQIFARVGARNLNFFNERASAGMTPKPQPVPTRSSNKKRSETRLAGLAIEVDPGIARRAEDDLHVPEKLAPMVVIITELADLMVAAPADFEKLMAQIMPMGRAVGVHCIIGTRRPEAEIITNVIKTNSPARIAFQVASRMDSRTILDAMGAEKLLGKGDMFYLAPGSANLKRAQGALITEHELQKVLDYICSRPGKSKTQKTKQHP